MKKVPKKCLACAHMQFLNDEDDSPLTCILSDGEVAEDFHCGFYEVDKDVQKDAEMGMWK